MADKRNSSAETVPKGSPLARFTRLFEHVDIYESEKYGNETIENTVIDLIKAVRSEKLINVMGQCEAYNKLGIAYYRLLRFDKAEVCHQKHLLLSQPKNKDMLKRGRELNKKEMKIALVNLGCTFHAKREYPLALEAYEAAMKVAREV